MTSCRHGLSDGANGPSGITGSMAGTLAGGMHPPSGTAGAHPFSKEHEKDPTTCPLLVQSGEHADAEHDGPLHWIT